MRAAAREMWERTSLTPTDVDAALVYDGFTVIPILWLEALGFCELGAGGPFVATPGTIELGGTLPANTDGGQLSGGRLHGYGLLYEACLQLRGHAGARQIADADVAVVTNGVGPTAGCVLLSR
jgi:acetyl-CoA acetyltransferase